jgi:hypothetical protein
VSDELHAQADKLADAITDRLCAMLADPAHYWLRGTDFRRETGSLYLSARGRKTEPQLAIHAGGTATVNGRFVSLAAIGADNAHRLQDAFDDALALAQARGRVADLELITAALDRDSGSEEKK